MKIAGCAQSDFGDPMAFLLVPLLGQNFHLCSDLKALCRALARVSLSYIKLGSLDIGEVVQIRGAQTIHSERGDEVMTLPPTTLRSTAAQVTSP